jgi:putative FmdB family regulatory protein
MPIYEYRCESCGKELEKIQKFSDQPLNDCPECGKPSLKKLVSASSFRLKGTGWYETDFKNKNKPAANEEKDSGKAKDGQSEDSGTQGSTSEKEQKEKPSTSKESGQKSNSGDKGSKKED